MDMRLEEEIGDQSSISHMMSVLFQPMMEKNMYGKGLEIHFFELKEKKEASWSPSFFFILLA